MDNRNLTLGIIGTAGRGEDGSKLPYLWKTMNAVTQIVITITDPNHLVSGGAAYADHLAVQYFLNNSIKGLTLHLPALWTTFGFKETSSRFDCGRTSNYYHTIFSDVLNIDSLTEIDKAIEKGAIVKCGSGGFKERNTDISNQADIMLAFTFGNGPNLKDGGTLDTMTKFLNRRTLNINLQAYHFNLNDKKLYRL